MPRWYTLLFFCFCAQNWEISANTEGGRDVQGTARFQQRDVLLQNEPGFSRKYRDKKEQEAGSGMVICLSQELLKETTCHFEPNRPEEGTTCSEK